MDFTEPCPFVRPGLPLFGFCSSGRSFASALLSDGASRRPPLRLASPLSHRTWAEDFHLPAVKHARHTRSDGRAAAPTALCKTAPTRFRTSAHRHHLFVIRRPDRKEPAREVQISTLLRG